MKKRFVVIGASAASIAFIAKLRSEDSMCEIICISGESDIPYNRCFLADFLSRDITAHDMRLKPDDFFSKNNIMLRLGTLVTKIDPQNNRVFIEKETISYDYLFLGIGTKPIIPQSIIDQSIDSAIFTFHTKADIDKIATFIEENNPKKMIVVGAGLNGLECASSLHDRGISVTLVEGSSHILPTQVDEELASYISEHMQKVSINLFAGFKVRKVAVDNSGVISVLLQDNTQLQADGVVFAVGSGVNSDILFDTGIATSEGFILVDEGMKSSVSNIYAGGDICMVYDCITKAAVRSATWADAMLQGLCAATQFGAKPRNYPGYVGLRDSYFFGQEFYACGQTIDFKVPVQHIRLTTQKGIKVFYVHDQRLLGFVLLGDVSNIAQYKQWYMTKQIIAENLFL